MGIHTQKSRAVRMRCATEDLNVTSPAMKGTSGIYQTLMQYNAIMKNIDIHLRWVDREEGTVFVVKICRLYKKYIIIIDT